MKTPSNEWSNIKGTKRTRLIAERKKLKLTQAQLAEKLNVSKATISHLENSRVNPGFELSIKYEELLNLSFEILFPDL